MPMCLSGVLTYSKVDIWLAEWFPVWQQELCQVPYVDYLQAVKEGCVTSS